MTDIAQKVRLVLKFKDWPDRDRRLWAELTASGTLFEDGPFAAWSDGTTRLRRQGYGQWLSYLVRCSPEVLERAPADRITVEAVRGYVGECRARLKDCSTYNLVTSLMVVAMAMDPDRDWSWLQRVQMRLRHFQDDTKLPVRSILSADMIFDWSLKRLREVEGLQKGSDRQHAIWYRQALMIGVLIARPVRRRALLAMEVEKHLLAVDEGYQMRFSASDMKDRRDRSYPFPARLVEPMSRYLEHYRPVLLPATQATRCGLASTAHP